jgi:copper chaperone CopZ
MTVETFPVVGMTCGHCVQAVTSEFKELPGVTEVAVDLVAGGTSNVTVTSDRPLDRDDVAAAVDEAGYALASPTVGAAPAPDGRGGLPLA